MEYTFNLCHTICIWFLLPLLQLSKWAYLNFLSQFNLEHIFISLQSMLLAGVTALITIIFTLLPRLFSNMESIKNNEAFSKNYHRGYIIPGCYWDNLSCSSSYLVNSVYNLFEIEIGHIVYSSIYVLVFAYLFRFLAVSYNPIEAHSLKVVQIFLNPLICLGNQKCIPFITFNFLC